MDVVNAEQVCLDMAAPSTTLGICTI
jgi:hypothetical protein